MSLRCPICLDDKKIVSMEKHLNLYKCNCCLHTFTVVSKEKQEVYDEDYFLKTHKAWFSNPNYGLFEFICKKIKQFLAGKEILLLDAGCGKGDLLRYILMRQPSAGLYGIDLVKNEHPGIHFIEGSIYDLRAEDFKSKFNVVCGLEVIEHLDDPQLFTRKLSSLMENGAILVISTRNNNSLMYRIARVLNKLGLRTAHDRLYSIHHLQHYTNQSLQKLLRMNGFEVLISRNHNYPLRAVDVPEASAIVQKAYKLIVALIFMLSSLFGAGITQTVICRKKG